MNLVDMSLEDRVKLTRSYPILIVSSPGQGKSTSIEFLSEEDKSRTIIIDADNKNLPDDDPSIYRSVFKIKPYEGGELCVDSGNVKYIGLEEIIALIKKAISHNKVDRVIIDTFSGLVNEAELYYNKTLSGFNKWSAYNDFLTEFFSTIKLYTQTHGKFVYVFGHYKPFKDPKDVDGEKYCSVKGKEHYRLVESNFNTVIEIEDYKFKADNSSSFDSTKVKRSVSPLETKENSLAELEIILTK
jgi:hypothetical protein